MRHFTGQVGLCNFQGISGLQIFKSEIAKSVKFESELPIPILSLPNITHPIERQDITD